MSDVTTDGEHLHFKGFEHNAYQNNMHSLAMISLWLIIIAGVACGVFGFIWGITH